MKYSSTKMKQKIEDQKYFKAQFISMEELFQGNFFFFFGCLVIFLKMLKKYLLELVSYEKS